MKRTGAILLLLGCLVLSGMGQDKAWASCIEGQELPFDPAELRVANQWGDSELEQRISALELQLQNVGRSTALDDETFLRVKLELAELYNQLPRERMPLDDGANTCPAVNLPNNVMPFTDYGTTIGATNNFTPITPCGVTNAPDKIYRIIPAVTGMYTFDTFGSNFDTQLYVNTGGACPGNTQVACNDDFGGSQSRVQVWMTAGTAYWIIVDGFQNYSGNFVLNLTSSCIVGNSSGWQQECAESVGDPSHAQWDCNGGCDNFWNGGFQFYQGINLCQGVRGSCFTYLDANSISRRDIDCYYFTLTEPTFIEISVLSTFSFNIQINDYGICPGINYFSLLNQPACYAVTANSVCLPAGTYSFEISPNFFTGMPAPQGYYFLLSPAPCSGCRVDGQIAAPASFTANGCDQISHNSLRPSQDATYCITIPYASDWTFDLCGSAVEWNSYLYLTSQCNGGIIAQNNDFCGPNSHARLSCVSLQEGNYYLTIEGFNAVDCGSFYMNITPCTGSCCYGNDPYNLQCSFVSQTECAQLGGQFTLGQQCTPQLCGVRPQCEDSSQFSQLPHLPTESWTAIASDVYIGYSLWDEYTASGPISSIRFWGLYTDYNNGLPCFTQPEDFQITFVDSSNGPAVQVYNGTANGYLMPQNYGPNFPVYQYDFDLPTDCNILSGRVSVRGTSNNSCVFAWVSSPQGNGSIVLHNPGGPVSLPNDMAFCLSEGCPKPDSVVIRRGAVANSYDILFSLPVDSYVRLFYSDSINAVYPSTYVELTVGSLNAGNWVATDNTASVNRRYLLTAQCGPPPILGFESGAFKRIE